MRIRIQCECELLRRGLADLVREAGHEVVARTEHLRIFVHGTKAPDGPSPTLWLHPPPDRRPDPDPARALERVLAGGGIAIWAEPFEPSLLLDVLSGPQAEADGPLVSPAAPVAVSPYPWMLADAGRGVVLWANVAAKQLFGMTDSDVRNALGEATLARLRLPLERHEGHCQVEIDKHPWHAVWWTDGQARRVLGMLPWPRRGGRSNHPNLRTLAELGRVSATLAHEIRNPVAAFAGAIDLLQRDLPDAERAEIVALARARIDHMRALLDDTLRLAKPLRGPPQPVDVFAVAQSAIETLRLDPRCSAVAYRLDGDRVAAMGYEQPLQQALVNVLYNACQAQGCTGEIVVEVLRRRGRAVVRVRDQGPGVPPEHRERIFEPFWTTKSAGTGLGLSFAKRVVEAGRGTIRVEKSSEGAVIGIHLRLAPFDLGA